jgi:flagellar motor switch protein FliN
MVDKGKLTQDEINALFGTNTEEPFSFKELEEVERESEPIQNEERVQQSSPKQSVEQSVNLPLLLDIPLEVVVELGRTKKKISEVLELTSGSIVELDKMSGEPVDVYVNGKLVAKGEVVVIDEHFGVRIKEIIQSVL